MNITLTTDWIKANAKMIHYFGLGFIQVKLDDFNRLHFYTNLLKKTVEKEEIHNHRYNFVSRVLCGTLHQEIYDVRVLQIGDIKAKEELITHTLTQESCQAGDETEYPKIPCTMELVFSHDYMSGESYYIDHNTFHTVDSSDAVTHVCRSKYTKQLADVVYPKNRSELTCPFSIKVKTDKLYEIIDERLKSEK
jgi:hypothetical protein